MDEKVSKLYGVEEKGMATYSRATEDSFAGCCEGEGAGCKCWLHCACLE